ncbi:hypothetical protein PFISCL1PPCAC_17897, partial [Pristionchus fissidentatus]
SFAIKLLNRAEFAPIYDALVKENIEAYEAGNIDAIAAMYDEHAVIVRKKEEQSFYGISAIKQMVEAHSKLGKMDFKRLGNVIYDLGGDRFFVDVDFAATIVTNGVEIKGSYVQIIEKKEDGYKCVFECYSVQ